MKDFKYIFDLFEIDKINKIFTTLIAEKFRDKDIEYSFLDEKEEDFITLFTIFQNILICEDRNNLTLTTPVQVNYHFTSKFYLFLLSSGKAKFYH